MATRKIIRKKKIKRASVEKVNDLTAGMYHPYTSGITQSLISAYRNCKRLFLYKINKIRSSKETGTALFGNIVHYCLSKICMGKSNVNLLIRNFYKHEAGNIAALDENFIELTNTKAKAVLDAYVKFYKNIDKSNKYIFAEKEISVNYAENILRMKIDAGVEIGGSKWVVERKTKSRISEDVLLKTLCYDNQNLIYLFGAEKYFNTKFKGVLYDIIRNPQLRINKQETLQEYYQRLVNDIEERPSFYFIRYKIPYTLKERKLFSYELTNTLENIERDIFKVNDCTNANNTLNNASAIFYKNPGSCAGVFTCEYIDACASGNLSLYEKGDKIFPELNHAC